MLNGTEISEFSIITIHYTELGLEPNQNHKCNVNTRRVSMTFYFFMFWALNWYIRFQLKIKSVA